MTTTGPRQVVTEVVARYRLAPWEQHGTMAWSPVRRSVPLFRGHRQPRVPSFLGYYDVRDRKAQRAQWSLAAEHGITAWCYDLGVDAMCERIPSFIKEIVAQQEVGFRYCIRTVWDSPDHVPTLSASLSIDLSRRANRLMEMLAPHLDDPRYVQIDRRPMVLVCGLGDRETLAVSEAIRNRAARLALGEPFLVAEQKWPVTDLVVEAVDACAEASPLGVTPWSSATELERAPRLFASRQWKGRFIDYSTAMSESLASGPAAVPWFRTCIPGWDSTPRLAEAAIIAVGDDPATFGNWVLRALELTYLFNDPKHWLILIDSWNGWHDGSQLEPELDLGEARLEALVAALDQTKGLAAEIASSHGAPSTGTILAVAKKYAESACAIARAHLSERAGGGRQPA